MKQTCSSDTPNLRIATVLVNGLKTCKIESHRPQKRQVRGPSRRRDCLGETMRLRVEESEVEAESRVIPSKPGQDHLD